MDKVGILLVQHHRRWPSIISALDHVACYLGRPSGFSGVTRIVVQANTGQSSNAVSM